MEGINDIFIQSTSGIPYIARCYGGNYCKTQPDHELVTGFFAAINSFRGELGQKELSNVIYDQINLVFESENDLLVVCNVDRDVDEKAFREISTKIKEKFVKDYGSEDNVRNRSSFSPFVEWLDTVMGQGMADLTPLIKGRSDSLLGRIKSWFS